MPVVEAKGVLVLGFDVAALVLLLEVVLPSRGLEGEGDFLHFIDDEVAGL